MTTRRSKTEDAARLLQQRREINDQDFFLTHLTREEALQIASNFRGELPSSDSKSSAKHQDTIVRSEPPSLPAVELPKSYTDLRNHALACTQCGLAEGRKNVVFSDGVEDASVMVVGEALVSHSSVPRENFSICCLQRLTCHERRTRTFATCLNAVPQVIEIRSLTRSNRAHLS